LQASRNAHPPQADCAFEPACASPSGVIRGCETTSIVFIYGPAAKRFSQHFKEIERVLSYHLAPVGARSIKVFGQTGDDNL
jgi:hypothetical protein